MKSNFKTMKKQMIKRIMVKERSGAGVRRSGKFGNKQLSKFVDVDWMLKALTQVNVNKVSVYSFEKCNVEKHYKQLFK